MSTSDGAVPHSSARETAELDVNRVGSREPKSKSLIVCGTARPVSLIKTTTCDANTFDSVRDASDLAFPEMLTRPRWAEVRFLTDQGLISEN